MRRLLALLVLVVALVGAGCGGGDDGGDTGTATGPTKADYGRQLAQAGQTLQAAFADLADQTGTNTSSKEIGARLDRGAAALDEAGKQFGAIQPPADARAAHEKLVSGLDELAVVVRKAAAAARKNDTTTLAKALQEMTRGNRKITEAQAELEAKGVTVTTPAK